MIGLGATGLQAARFLGRFPDLHVIGYDSDPDRISLLRKEVPTAQIGDGSAHGARVAILATPAGHHQIRARDLVERGVHVVSVSDHPADVSALLELDALARARQRWVLAACGFSPGLSCVLARHGANALDQVSGLSVAVTGTGGPACAREHHRALKSSTAEFHQGAWVTRAGGSGRELVWFPDPIGARDCYRADLASPEILHRMFPEATRVTARMSATRRDRLTSRLPMLRPPHADGGPGAIRVEIRGSRHGAIETITYGVAEHPSRAAGVISALVARGLADPNAAIETSMPDSPGGAATVGEWADPLAMLRLVIATGMSVMTYEGIFAESSTLAQSPNKHAR